MAGKWALILTWAIVSSAASASGTWGDLLPVREKDGAPLISVEYSLKAPPYVRFSYETNLTQSELNRFPDVIEWAFLSLRSQNIISPWRDVSPAQMIAHTVTVDHPLDGQFVIRNLRNGAIAFIGWQKRVSAGAFPLFHMDFGQYCETHPEKFLNRDTGQMGCP